jgi:hypothetical protein
MNRFAMHLVLAAGMCGVAHAQCQDVYRTNLPDLDQRRASAPGIVGLPWNGSAHCVPASWANNIAFIANNGLPELLQNQTFNNWQDPASYNAAGTLINTLGTLMGVTSTGAANSISGIQAWLNNRAPGMLVGGGKNWTGSPKDMREVLLAGGFIAVTRGFYQLPPDSASWEWYGGHIVTVRGVHDVCELEPMISVRDPNTNPQTESLFAQSFFATRYDRMSKVSLLVTIDDQVYSRMVWKFNDFTGVNPSTGWTARRLMDGYATLMPTIALMGKPVVGDEPSGVDFLRPLVLTDNVHPTHGGGSLMPPGTGTIRAVHIDPSLAYAFVLADNPNGGTRLLSVGMGSGTVETKYEFENPIVTSFISHEGEVYASTGTDLFRIAPDDEGLWQTREHVLLATQVMAMGEDDAAGEIVMICQGSTGAMIVRRPLELALPEGPQLPCPPGVEFDGPVEIALHPQTGEVLCSSPGVGAIYRLAMGAAGGWTLVETIALEPGSQPTCPTWTDTGSVMFVNNGVVQEFESVAGAGWLPKENSLYAGTVVPPGQVFRLAITRPKAEPPLPEQIPDELLPEQQDFCSNDFDGDGDIGTDADIEAFFACLAGDCCVRCGSADFDGDGDIGTDADIEAFFRVLAGGAC